MSTQALPLYLRKYQLDVALPGKIITVASDQYEPEALRITFDCYQLAFNQFWYSDITIYNLSNDLASEIMGAVQYQSAQVTLQAGYKNSPQGGYGTIWSGPVFQTLFDRENVVDSRLTLHCMIGLEEASRNFVSNTYSGVTQADVFRKIAEQAMVTKIGYDASRVSDKIKKDPLPRGKVVFGSPGKYFEQIASDNNCQWWLDKKGVVLSGMADSDIPKTAQLTLKPPVLPNANSISGNPTTPGDGVIIDTPQQTPQGIGLRILLDSRFQVNKPYVTFGIDNTLIRQIKLNVNPNQSPQISPLDQDGVYVVAGARFSGDTRGDEWYVEIDGYVCKDGIIDLLAKRAQNTNGG